VSALRKPGTPAVFDPAAARRRSLIGKIHVAKTQLGIDEELYRDVLFDKVQRRSAKDCTDAELVTLIKHFEARGFTAKAKRPGPKPADLPFANKARAMWISLHQLGAIDDPSEDALEAFCRRQMKVAKMQWADATRAYKMIEALKDMAVREGWDQSTKGVKPESKILVLKRRLVAALHAKLIAADAIPAHWSAELAASELAGVKFQALLFYGDHELGLIASAFGRKLRDGAA
jgi:phage gp16-like protein